MISTRSLGRGRVPAASPPRLMPLVFVGGMASLGSEIAAARLIAPYFGSSTVIWANTIAVVLLALSLGYWLGGTVADRHPYEGALRATILAAAVLLALIPFGAGPFFEAMVNELDDVAGGLFIGSLLAILVPAGLPLLLLGTLAPWAVRLAVETVEDSGRIAGRLYAVSTLGSLAGVFLAALVLIPLFGTQRTFGVLALLLAVAAASSPQLPRPALAAVPVIAALLVIPPGAAA